MTVFIIIFEMDLNKLKQLFMGNVCVQRVGEQSTFLSVGISVLVYVRKLFFFKQHLFKFLSHAFLAKSLPQKNLNMFGNCDFVLAPSNCRRPARLITSSLRKLVQPQLALKHQLEKRPQQQATMNTCCAKYAAYCRRSSSCISNISIRVGNSPNYVVIIILLVFLTTCSLNSLQRQGLYRNMFICAECVRSTSAKSVCGLAVLIQ